MKKELQKDVVVSTKGGNGFLVNRADDHDKQNVEDVDAAHNYEPAEGSELWWIRTRERMILEWVHPNNIVDPDELAFTSWSSGTLFRASFGRADLRAAKANLETIAARFELPSPLKQMGDDEIIQESRQDALARARKEVAHLADAAQAIIERLDACVIHLKSAEKAEGALANEHPSAMGEGTHRTNEDSVASEDEAVKKFTQHEKHGERIDVRPDNYMDADDCPPKFK